MPGAQPDRRSWDADRYHRVSSAMDDMAGEVLDRLVLRGDETVLDAGCGTGRVTARLVERLPAGRVVAVDADPDMVRVARATLPPEVDVRHADLLELRLDVPVDTVFSTATFHWVLDHDRLFERLAAALPPGGRLVAQCGGEGNIEAVVAAASAVAGRADWRNEFGGFRPNWYFASPAATEERLARAGFGDIRCWLQPFPVAPDDPVAYLETVPLGPWVQRLPDGRRGAFAAEVADRMGGPVVLDYVRLNVDATRR